jgi:hypothetical protein
VRFTGNIAWTECFAFLFGFPVQGLSFFSVKFDAFSRDPVPRIARQGYTAAFNEAHTRSGVTYYFAPLLLFDAVALAGP